MFPEKKTCGGYQLLAALCFLLMHSCGSDNRKENAEGKTSSTPTGEELSKMYCSSCHVYPSPDLLDKTSWRKGVLPQMGYRLGIYGKTRRDSLLEKGLGGRMVELAGVFPQKQTIDNETWEQIREFYLDHAPNALPETKQKKIERQLSTFTPLSPSFNVHHPVVTQIKYNPSRHQFYVTNTKGNHTELNILDSRFKTITTLGLPDLVSNISFRSDTLFILMIGSLTPSDAPAGKLIKTVKDKSGKSYEGYSLILKNLRRPVDIAYADLDNDHLEDMVVCEFGNHTGSVTWFKNKGKGKFTRNILFDSPGAIKVTIADMNNDSLKDILVLMAQGDEGMDIYYNLGNGRFRRERVLRFPPVYGSMFFELVDFNGDGHHDIVYVNGDNADYSPVLKPYHGIRIFLNNGENQFSESFFYPMYGAYKAHARDFDNDGDMDIAAISFFPDFFNQQESFIYLQNVSQQNHFEFNAATFSGSDKGRWITMEAEDIDGDGDDDLMLGSFTGMDIVGDSGRAMIKKYIDESPAFIVLKNISAAKTKK